MDTRISNFSPHSQADFRRCLRVQGSTPCSGRQYNTQGSTCRAVSGRARIAVLKSARGIYPACKLVKGSKIPVFFTLLGLTDLSPLVVRVYVGRGGPAGPKSFAGNDLRRLGRANTMPRILIRLVSSELRRAYFDSQSVSENFKINSRYPLDNDDNSSIIMT